MDDIQHGAADGNGKPWGSARQFLFEYNDIMDIPFAIDGLPIKHLVSRQMEDGRTGLFKVDPVAGTDFLACSATLN